MSKDYSSRELLKAMGRPSYRMHENVFLPADGVRTNLLFVFLLRNPILS